MLKLIIVYVLIIGLLFTAILIVITFFYIWLSFVNLIVSDTLSITVNPHFSLLIACIFEGNFIFMYIFEAFESIRLISFVLIFLF